jgi:hypothetical protein
VAAFPALCLNCRPAQANSHRPCRSHAAPMPFPCHAVPLSVLIVSLPFDLHSAAVFDSHMPCRAHAAPVPCHDHAVLKATSQGHGTTRYRRGMSMAWHYELASAVQRRHVGDPPAFGFFRLPRRISRRTRHCRIIAGARHGMCELTRHGMGAAWHV